jgi:hypothetical protein
MRLSPFLPLYFGVLLATNLILPVPSEYVWAPDSSATPTFSSECIDIGVVNGSAWVAVKGVVRLHGDSVHEALPMKFHAESRNADLDWTPSQGDSFDIAGHHTWILRFPKVEADTLIGRAYPPSYFNLFDALLSRPRFVTAVRVACPRSGGVLPP